MIRYELQESINTATVVNKAGDLDNVEQQASGMAFVERDEIEVKAKGKMRTYFLEKALVDE